MEIHTCLWNEVGAFDFESQDFGMLAEALPTATFRHHRDEQSFLDSAATAEYVLTWDFPAQWYRAAPHLKAVLTPAAGNDWVEPDPTGRVELVHGTFHGPMIAESLLSAILFMNHKMPAMITNFQKRGWDRNLQRGSRLLRQQDVLIIGYGSIGKTCAAMLQPLCRSVSAVRRRPEPSAPNGIAEYAVAQLDDLLPHADHIVCILPATPDTDGILSEARLKQLRGNTIVYNFGRGNAIKSQDLVAASGHYGGAFLDVTDEEPLPETSPLWSAPNVFITPHSSCVYEDYKPLFLGEVLAYLKQSTDDT